MSVEFLKISSIVLAVIVSIGLVGRLLLEAGILRGQSLLISNLSKMAASLMIGVKNAYSCILPKNSDSRLFIQLGFLVIVTRAVIYWMGYVSHVFLLQDEVPFMQTWEMLWNRWDSIHYLHIAQTGYLPLHNDPFIIYFPPLYPLLIKTAHLFFRDYFLSGIFVSNMALTVGCYFLYKIAALDHGPKVAFRAVQFLLISPFSLFFAGVYTEGLFIALTLAAVYAMRKRRWALAGLMGMLGILTRAVHGNVICAVFLVEYFMSEDIAGKIRAKNWPLLHKDICSAVTFVLFIFSADFLYLLQGKMFRQDWFAFLHYQTGFWRHRIVMFYDSIAEAANLMGHYRLWDNIVLWIPTITAFFLTGALICFGLKKLRLSYLAYLYFYFFLTFSTTWLLSGARYMTAAFPIYIILGIVTDKQPVRFILLFVSMALLMFMTIAFTRGSYLM